MSNDKRHISTTHNERYYHIKTDAGLRGTVFFRQGTPRDEADMSTDWKASVAICHWRDQYNKASGRNVARRKFFAGKCVPVQNSISYDTAQALFYQALAGYKGGSD